MDYNTIFMDEMMERILQAKDQKLRQVVASHGLIDSLEKDSERRFKKFVHEIHPEGIEKFYYNDGSEDGLLLLSLKTVNTGFEMKIEIINQSEQGMLFDKIDDVEWEGKYPDFMITAATCDGVPMSETTLSILNDNSQVVHELVQKFKV